MREIHGMRLGLAAWGLRETPLSQQLEMCGRLGVDALELSIGNGSGDPLQPDSDAAAAIRVSRQFAAAGVTPEYGCTGNDFTGDDVPEQLERLRRVIAVAAESGVRRLRIFGGFASDSAMTGSRFRRMCDALASAADFAAGLEIRLAVETHGGVRADSGALIHFASATTRADWWNDILAAGVEMVYDPANLAAAGAADPVAFYRRFKPAVSHVHLKDFRDVPGGVAPAACGEGRLDWPQLMAGLQDCAGTALIEYELPDDVESGMRRSLDFLERFA